MLEKLMVKKVLLCTTLNITIEHSTSYSVGIVQILVLKISEGNDVRHNSLRAYGNAIKRERHEFTVSRARESIRS